MYDDLDTSNQTVGSVNISDKISDTTGKILRQLSGKENRGKKKVIDNVITFMGAAGGTGVSTIVANVAQEVVQSNLSVLIIDSNICYPAQHNFFRIKQDIHKNDFVSFITGKSTIGECVEYRGELGILTSNNRNLMDYLNCDTKSAAKNMEECLDRMASLFDVVLIDCTNKLEHDIISTILYKSNAIYCVWDEGVGCIANFEKIRGNMRILGVDPSKIRVVLNKKTNIYYRESVFKDLNAELIEVLPFDTAIIESGLKAEVFIKSGSSTSKTAKEYTRGINSLTNKVLKLGGYNHGQ